MPRTAEELDLLKQGFQTFLGRNPEPEAIIAFEASDIPIEQRLEEIKQSPEFKKKQFGQSFQELLGRQPEPGATEAFLKSGIPLEQRIQEIEQSPERQKYLATQELVQAIPNLPNQAQFQLQPLKSFEDTYQQLYEHSGLSNVKQNIESVLGQIDTLEQERLAEIAKINDNPWLTEGIRHARLSKVNQQYDQKKGLLANQLSMAQNLYDRSREDIKFIAKNTLEQMSEQQKFQERMLDRVIKRAEQEAESRRKAFEFESEFDLKKQQFGFRQAQEVRKGQEFEAEFGLRQEQEQRRLAEDQSRAESRQLRSVQGGLYDVKGGEFIIPPKSGGRKVGGGGEGVKLSKSDRNIALAAGINPDQNAGLANNFIRGPLKTIFNDATNAIKKGASILPVLDRIAKTDMADEEKSVLIKNIAKRFNYRLGSPISSQILKYAK